MFLLLLVLVLSRCLFINRCQLMSLKLSTFVYVSHADAMSICCQALNKLLFQFYWNVFFFNEFSRILLLLECYFNRKWIWTRSKHSETPPFLKCYFFRKLVSFNNNPLFSCKIAEVFFFFLLLIYVINVVYFSSGICSMMLSSIE